ncbi:MAG: acyl-CoA dehydrogenase family protein [Cohaesibacteraceae bacterium]|nr:acyl-CoA dehydrogenase family protein [Cohaesibacteraceae bacterium]
MYQLSVDQQILQQKARELSDSDVRESAAQTDKSEEYPWHIVKKLTDAGFMGMTIPKEFGGAGLSYFDAVLVIEQVSRNCGVTGRIVVEANMGGVGAIMGYGSDTQKKMAASFVLAGDKPAICITEPGAGSAATEMSTTAVKTGDGYILNGKKHWITGGGVSKLHLVFARVIEDGEDKGIGGFIAIRDETEGLRIGKREYAMGLRGIPETEIIFEDMFIPSDRVIQLPEGFKRGFAALMSAYNGQRVGAATVAHGIAQGAYERAIEYAVKREQFGRPIAEFQGIQWMIADMSTGLAAAQAMIYRAAKSGGSGYPDKTAAAQAKIFAAENAIKVTNDALQIHGAVGYGRSLPMERMVRDARMFTIGGGTAQMLRNQVASAALEMKIPQTRDGFSKIQKAKEIA